MFTGGSSTGAGAAPPPGGFPADGAQRPDAEGVFGDVFEEVHILPGNFICVFIAYMSDAPSGDST